MLFRNVRLLIDYNGVRENVDIRISNGVIDCIGDCPPQGYEVVDCRGRIVYPCLSNPYIPLDSLVSRLGVSIDRVVEIACIESILHGITNIVFDGISSLDSKYCKLIDSYVLIKPGRDVSSKEVFGISLEGYSVEEWSRIVNSLNSGTRLFIPFLVSRREPFYFKRTYNEWPFTYLDNIGLFSKGLEYIFIYLNWLSSMDLEVISRYRDRVKAIVSPSKTLWASTGGFTPVYEIYGKGLWIGLTTSGLNSSIVDEMRLLYLLYKYNYWDERLDSFMVWRILMNNNDLFSTPKTVLEGLEACIVVSSIPGSLYSVEGLVYNSNSVKPEYVVYKGKVLLEPSTRYELEERYYSIMPSG